MMAMEKEKERPEPKSPLSREFEAKMDSMQKYLPFLSKLIEKLKGDPENETKVLQLELLQNILLCTEPRVSIEELNRCEESLQGIFMLYGTTTEVEMARDLQTFIKITEKGNEMKELKETTKKLVQDENQTLVEHEKEDPNKKQIKELKEEQNESENGSCEPEKGELAVDEGDCSIKENKSQLEIEKLNAANEVKENKKKEIETKNKIEKQIYENKKNEPETADAVLKENVLMKKYEGKEIPEKAFEEAESSQDNNSTEKEGKNKLQNTTNKEKINKEIISKELKVNTVRQTDESEKVENLKENQNMPDEKDVSAKPENFKEGDQNNIAKNDKESAETDEAIVENEEELQHEDNMAEVTSSGEEEEIEENVEVIKMPDENDAEEMILPDSADEMEQTNTTNSEMEDSNENEESNDDEMEQTNTTNSAMEDSNENEESNDDEMEQTNTTNSAMKDSNENEETKDNEMEQTNTTNSEMKDSNENEETKDNEMEQTNTTNSEMKDSNENEETKDDEMEQTNTANSEMKDSNENEETKDETVEENCIGEASNSHLEMPIVSELLAMEEVDTNVDKTVYDFDPLQCEETVQTEQQPDADKSAATESVDKNNDADDDDDDDVEIIETRNSPICIPSDSDDETNSAKAKTVENQPVAAAPKQRVFARKSTAQRAVIIPKRALMRLKNASGLSQMSVQAARSRPIDTVLLVDSSDEDEYKVLETRRYKNVQIGNISSKRFRYNANSNKYNKPSSSKSVNASEASAQVTAQKKCTIQPTIKLPMLTNKLPTVAKKSTISKLPTKAAATITAKSAETTASATTTPQSNFLNAINLQPTAPGEQPAAFLATLSNKKVIIPNAFYGNQRTDDKSVTTVKKTPAAAAATTIITVVEHKPETQSELHDRRWLENFLTHFSNPQEIASHRAYVLLESVLNYNTFMRIRTRRNDLNTLAHAHKAVEQVDIELLLELRNIFYMHNKRLSIVGQRFCELARTMLQGRVVALTMDAETGHVTASTRAGRTPMAVDYVSSSAEQEQQKPKTTISGTSTTVASNFSGVFKLATLTNIVDSAATLTASARKREREDAEYMPNKAVSIFDGESSCERKRSLRAKSARRYDEDSYLQEEEFLSEDADSSESYAEVQRKVEQKRLEAQRHREEQVKSFECAFVETFKTKDATEDAVPSTSRTFRKRLRGQDVQKFAAIADDCNLLTPTWIECAPSECNNRVSNKPSAIIDDDDSLILLDDNEPREHRIYKVMPTKLTSVKMMDDAEKQQEQQQHRLQTEATMRLRSRVRKEQAEQVEQPEIIICDDFDDTDSSSNCVTTEADIVAIASELSVETPPPYAPKNTDLAMHTLSEFTDWCVLCRRRVPRLVHHYVNDHRDREVYISRLCDAQVRNLLSHSKLTAKVHIYKNGQLQFDASCIFCEKQARFMLPYWYQHFAMHTGEYAYRCNGCGIRKPTRSLLQAHVNLPCLKHGRLCQDYTPSSRLQHIEAHMCTLCNYVQLYRPRIMRHLNMEHNILSASVRHVQVLTLLRLPIAVLPSGTSDKATADNRAQENSASTDTTSLHQGGGVFTDDNNAIWQAGQWDDGDPSDDLSFMISGMLDVQMNTE